MMPRTLLPAVLAAVSMTGCVSMAPRYHTPLPPVPTQFPPASSPQGEAPAQGHGATAAADVEWKQFYADERLQKVLELAMANNRDLRVAALNTEKARAYYRIQRSALLPTVNAVGMETRERIPASVSGMNEPWSPREFGVSAGITSWEIDFFGRIQSLKKQALEQFLATAQAHRAAQLSLRAEVANAYLTLAGDREALKLAQETLTSQESTYKLVQRSFEVGSSSEINARRAQISAESARVDVASFTRIVALDETALNVLVGSPVPPALLVDGLSSLKALREDFTIGLPSEVLVNRPDILMAESQLKAANANIGAARAAFFPSISLTTNFGTMDTRLSGLFKSGSDAWTFSPQIVLPLFDYGARSASLKVSKVDRDIYVAQYEKAIQVAFKEVSDALVQRDSLRDQRVAQEALTKAMDVTYRLTKARYDVGIDGSLSVLDAQRSLYGAQQALISLRQTELRNLVTLYKVLGGGAHRPQAVKARS